MITRKVAVITLIQNLDDENPPALHELKHQIQHFFGSSPLSKLWKVERVTFLEDTLTHLETKPRWHEDKTKERKSLAMNKQVEID